jgi:hypothetical protein
MTCKRIISASTDRHKSTKLLYLIKKLNLTTLLYISYWCRSYFGSKTNNASGRIACSNIHMPYNNL